MEDAVLPRVMVVLSALVLTAGAHAAEVTDMPPALRGDVSIRYDGTFYLGGLEEQGSIYGRQQVLRHDLQYQIEFAPIDGLAFNVSLPHTPSVTVKYSAARQMTFDPVTATGTYTAGSDLAELPVTRGGGVTGVWFGAAFSPFAERYARNQQVTWRLDVGYRTRAGRSFWEEVDGKRGAAWGSHALRLGAAFSTDHERTNPYLAATWVQETRREVEIAGPLGLAPVQVKPASTIDLVTGVEIVASPPAPPGEVAKQRIAVDLFLGFGYRSWSDVPSGILLPSVLDASRAIAVTTGDYIVVRTGAALDVHIRQYVGLRLGGEFGYATPHRLEHVYPVRTSLDSVQLGATASIEGRLR